MNSVNKDVVRGEITRDHILSSTQLLIVVVFPILGSSFFLLESDFISSIRSSITNYHNLSQSFFFFDVLSSLE